MTKGAWTAVQVERAYSTLQQRAFLRRQLEVLGRPEEDVTELQRLTDLVIGGLLYEQVVPALRQAVQAALRAELLAADKALREMGVED